MIKVRRIEQSDPLYQQALALREDEILRPLGLSLDRFHAEFPGVEERLEHFVATVDVMGTRRVIACASLLANDPPDATEPSGRMMQMAVSRQRQREGIGTMLVAALEKRAFGELDLKHLFSNVPVRSVGFCQSLGWEIVSDEFLEGGVPHRRMVIHAPTQAPGAIEPDPIDDL